MAYTANSCSDPKVVNCSGKMDPNLEPKKRERNKLRNLILHPEKDAKQISCSQKTTDERQTNLLLTAKSDYATNPKSSPGKMGGTQI